MKKLSTVMLDMPNTAQELNGTINSTAQHGSIAKVGVVSGQSRALSQSKKEEVESLKKQQLGECLERRIPISKCLESKRS